MWFPVNPHCGSWWIHHDPQLGSTRIHNRDSQWESTKIHNGDPPGSIMGIHHDPQWGSTRIHNWDPTGSTMETCQDPQWGFIRIHNGDPGSTIGIHQDPYENPPGSEIRIHLTCIHQDTLSGSSTGTNQDPQSTRDPHWGSTRIQYSDSLRIHHQESPRLTKIHCVMLLVDM